MKNLFKIMLIVSIFLFSACSSGEPSKEPAVWVPGWKTTNSLIVPRAGAAIVENNGYIYMLAGFDGHNILKSTEYAKIQEDGTLGPWKAGPDLNDERGFLEATVHNGSIYVVGGANAPDVKTAYASNLLASTERAVIQPDGSLSPWVKEKNSMLIPRRCNKVAKWGNHIYSVGGYGGVMLDSIDRAEILEDGTVGKWVLDKEKMLVPHYVNGVKAKKGALYVFGGHDAAKGVGIKMVEWSKITETGALVPWKSTSQLQVGRYGLATAYHDGYFYVLGGFTGKDFLDSVEKAKLLPDGEVSPWEFTTPVATLKLSFSVVVYKDWIYAIGGGTGDVDSISTVEYATFDDKGDIGYWGSAADEAANKKKAAKREEALQNVGLDKLPYEGVVKEVIQTETYTYIRVSGKDGAEGWLAGPKTELEVNDTIRFSEGPHMPDYYSKALDRTFKGIFFVGGLQKVPKGSE